VVKKQNLVYGGRELTWNDSLIKNYSVNGGDVLHLVLRLSDLLLIIVRTICGNWALTPSKELGFSTLGVSELQPNRDKSNVTHLL
jgi:hypothetical protein